MIFRERKETAKLSISRKQGKQKEVEKKKKITCTAKKEQMVRPKGR